MTDIYYWLNVIKTAFEVYGYPIILVSSLIEITPFGWAVPGGLILVIAGYLSNDIANISIFLVILTGTLGAWVSLLSAYILGRISGMWLVKKLKQERNAKFAKRLLSENGGIILTTSLLANLTRFWVSYVAGVDKYNLSKFAIFSFIASFSWVSLMSLIGYFVAYEKSYISKIVGAVGVLSWVLLAIAIVVIIRSIKHGYKHFKEDVFDENHK